jgi:hypothetical protein
VIVFHGHCEKAKAMSKTARRFCAWRSHERQKHPAILPWLSGLSDSNGRLAPTHRQPRCRTGMADASASAVDARGW